MDGGSAAMVGSVETMAPHAYSGTFARHPPACGTQVEGRASRIAALDRGLGDPALLDVVGDRSFLPACAGVDGALLFELLLSELLLCSTRTNSVRTWVRPRNRKGEAQCDNGDGGSPAFMGKAWGLLSSEAA